MSEFVILTDSSADLGADMVAELDIQVLPLSFTMEGTTYYNYPDNREIDPAVFYDRLRKGGVATTSAINPGQYVEYLTPILAGGQDVLLLVFSSGLSSTYQNSLLAAEELRAQYPDRKLYEVDTLAPLAARHCWSIMPLSGGKKAPVWRKPEIGWKKTSSIWPTGSP